MKRMMILFVLLHATVYVTAQRQTERQTEYNRQGDEAMKRLDYSAAKIWYEEGISSCNPHSIDQLTSIWLADASMRMSMRNVMSRCLDCLADRATDFNDTTSMKKLIQYYTEGIGTDKNQAKVDFWTSQLTLLQKASGTKEKTGIPPRKKIKMKFFAGYSGSYHAPYGLTVGSVGRFGWYLRYRTNFSFQKYTANSNNGRLTGTSYDHLLSGWTGREKTNAWMATGGLIVMATPSFYISAGGGYCNRERLKEFHTVDRTEAEPRGDVWAKNSEKGTFNGLALDVDGTFRIGKVFYGSLGCTVLDLKYISGNAGIGVFF
jgi:hypothetical protein